MSLCKRVSLAGCSNTPITNKKYHVCLDVRLYVIGLFDNKNVNIRIEM